MGHRIMFLYCRGWLIEWSLVFKEWIVYLEKVPLMLQFRFYISKDAYHIFKWCAFYCIPVSIPRYLNISWWLSLQEYESFLQGFAWLTILHLNRQLWFQKSSCMVRETTYWLVAAALCAVKRRKTTVLSCGMALLLILRHEVAS